MDKKTEESLEKIKKTSKTTIARAITRTVVKRSVSGILVTIIHTQCPTFNKSQKVQLYVGAWAVGGMIGDKAGDWAADEVSDAIDAVKNVIKIIKGETDEDSTEEVPSK